MTLQTRLTLVVTIMTVAAVALFGVLSCTVVDRTLRSSFYAQLGTTAQAVASIVDVHHGRVSLDADDLLQIASLHAGFPYALFNHRGVRVAGDVFPPPAKREGLAVLRIPVTRGAVVYGWIVVWESDAWIATVDQRIVLLAIVAGVVAVAIGVLISRRTARAFDSVLERLRASATRERRFAADASHELRTPLAVIKAECDLALRRERGAEEYRSAIESISHEAKHLEDLTTQLLAAARSEVDARDVGVIDIDRLATEAADRVRPAAAVREVCVLVARNHAARVRANGASLEHALLGVLHNAVNHARTGGTIQVRVEKSTEGVEIAVIDDGPGFSQEALAHATERFWRGDIGRLRGGTGLGLSIARTILEANGGSIRVKNRVEGGALVTLVLPGLAEP